MESYRHSCSDHTGRPSLMQPAAIAWAVLLVTVIAAATGCDRSAVMSDQNPSPKSESHQPEGSTGQMPPLSQAERHVIEDAGTEAPFSGEYWNHFETGTYVCRRCGAALYKSDDKFDSHCGWPSFDDEIPGAVTRRLDADGRRTEILCTNCGGHLGHVFLGEGFTDKNTRHCVNSLSLKFVPPAAQTKATATEEKLKRAYFAGGCFWGVEHHLADIAGVKEITAGYSGGETANPTYKQVCSGETGHAECVEVVFDPATVSYKQLAKRFFEIHDPTQYMRQGNDIGSQYRSAIFVTDEAQRQAVEELISQLTQRDYNVVTEVAKFEKFWPAENYHQDYLEKNPNGYCAHVVVKRFGD